MLRIDADLICVDGRGQRDVELSAKALEYSTRQVEFNNVILAAPFNVSGSHQFVEIRPLKSVEEYSEFVLKNLHKIGSSAKIMTVQSDGFITNPELWSDSWYQYDYIGAPWPANWPRREVYRVGNGGFSFRSRRLMEEASKLDYSAALEKIEDNFICLDSRPYLECLGFSFAPEDIAAQFSTENLTRFTTKSFGFHGKTNQLCNLIK